jgi:hypothetical protein
MARKHRNKPVYVLTVTVQRYSNIRNSSALSANVTVRLPSTSIDLEVEARRQGSTYVLDDSSSSESAGGIPAAKSPRLVQLDGFHEATHPYYWSPHTVLEAEMFSGFLRSGELDLAVGTERQGLATGNQYSFLGFASFVRLSCEPGTVRTRVFEYQFEPTADRAGAAAFMWVRARAHPSSQSAVLLHVRTQQPNSDNGTVGDSVTGVELQPGVDWTWQRVERPYAYASSGEMFNVGLECPPSDQGVGTIEVDRLVMTPDEAFVPV